MILWFGRHWSRRPRTFPHAEVTRLEDAGHYLQEDAQELIMPQLLRFLATLPDHLGEVELFCRAVRPV